MWELPEGIGGAFFLILGTSECLGSDTEHIFINLIDILWVESITYVGIANFCVLTCGQIL